ncbi:unnamed protein product, partial [Ectocarpus sp. 8 AP-2014]
MVLPPTKRMIHALTPPTGKAVAIPTPSELAFSEACTLLTKILLVEVRDVLRRHMSKKLVDDVLAQRPVNLLTWPEVAGDALVALVNHRANPEMRTSEMAALLSVRPSGWLARCGDMVAILISRPLAAAFVRPVDPAQVPGYADVVSKPMDLSTVRRRLWSRRYQWHQEVVDDLRLVWSNAKVFNQENTDFWHAADSLALLTESLYESWVLQPERRRDAESMKEAGLGVVDAPTPGASATAAAAAPGVTTPATATQVKQEEHTTPGTATAGETAATAAGGVVVVKKEDEHPAVGAAGTDATGAAMPSTPQAAASGVVPETPLSSSSPAAAVGTDISAASTAGAAAGTTTGMDIDQSGAGDADASITAAAATAVVVATVKTEQQQDTLAGAAQEAAAAAAATAAARLSPNGDGSTSGLGKKSSNSVEANGAASTTGTNGGGVKKPDSEGGQQRGNGGTAPAITTTTTAPPPA